MRPLQRHLWYPAIAFVCAAGATVITENASMNQTATGPFDVTLDTLQPYNQADPSMARRSIDKRFHGDLDAHSQGEMLSVGTARDNGGYVAIERVTGTLHGRRGSFALQHNATMTRGVPHLNIVVVPGSGS